LWSLFQGFYRGGRFIFSFKVGPNYPHEPPKVKCETPVYHPNIDLEGNVCLNILREDWKPVLTINSIVYGLQYLFLVRYYLITIRPFLTSVQLWQDIPFFLRHFQPHWLAMIHLFFLCCDPSALYFIPFCVTL
jgi:hypothetical protein